MQIQVLIDFTYSRELQTNYYNECKMLYKQLTHYSLYQVQTSIKQINNSLHYTSRYNKCGHWVIYIIICKCLVSELDVGSTLLRNKRFLVNLILQRNASKFAMFMEKENPCSFFSFFIQSNFHFPLMNALVYVEGLKNFFIFLYALFSLIKKKFKWAKLEPEKSFM